MNITIKANEFNENNLIIVLSAEEVDAIKDGCGIGYKFNEPINTKLYDVIVLKERTHEN